MASWNNRTAFANKGGFQRQPSLADFVSMLKFTSMEARKLRFIGPSLEYREHQIEIKLAAPSKKDGKTTTGFPKMCLAQVTSKPGTVCPYCEAGFPVKTLFMQNVIDRALQKRAPAKKGKPAESEMKVVKLWDGETKGKLKDIKSDLWTPLLVLKCTSSLADRVVDASEANQKIIKGKEVTFGAEHPRHGFDLLVKFDKDAPGASMYSASKTMNTKLSDEELAYPLWNLAAAKPETLAVAQKEVASIVVKAFVKDKDTKEMSPMFPDKADPKIWADWLAQNGSALSSKSGKKKGKQDQQQDEQDEDQQETLKVPKKKKKKPVQDQQDEKPAKKKKKKGDKVVKKKKKVEAVVKKTTKKKKKKAA